MNDFHLCLIFSLIFLTLGSFCLRWLLYERARWLREEREYLDWISAITFTSEGFSALHIKCRLFSEFGFKPLKAVEITQYAPNPGQVTVSLPKDCPVNCAEVKKFLVRHVIPQAMDPADLFVERRAV